MAAFVMLNEPINPYQPPDHAHQVGTITLLESLLQQTSNHRLMLWLYAGVYLTGAGISFVSKNQITASAMILLHLLLTLCAWFLLSETYSRAARLLLTTLTVIPIFNLLVLIINWNRITHISIAVGIQTSALGPVRSLIVERIELLRLEHKGV